MHGDCEECSTEGCLAEYIVWVPTDHTWTTNHEINVGADCVARAQARFEAEYGAFAQVDVLDYGSAA